MKANIHPSTGSYRDVQLRQQFAKSVLGKPALNVEVCSNVTIYTRRRLWIPPAESTVPSEMAPRQQRNGTSRNRSFKAAFAAFLLRRA